MGRPKSITLKNQDYLALAEEFYNYTLKLGYGLHGCRTKFLYLTEFLHWLTTKGITEITTTTPKDISKYYTYISERPSQKDGGILSKKTTYTHMKIIRDLFSMLIEKKRLHVNPCSTLYFTYPIETIERTILTQTEINQLYKATKTAQERAILSLGYGCGLRVSELVQCNIPDIRLKDKIILIPKGKGYKRRVVPLSKGVIKDIANYYYNEREALTKGRDFNPNESAFMLHSRGGRMRKGTYNKHLKEILQRTTIPKDKQEKLSMHCLRHSIATHLLEQGIGMQHVRLFLGHNHLESTQIYTHINQKQLQNLI